MLDRRTLLKLGAAGAATAWGVDRASGRSAAQLPEFELEEATISGLQSGMATHHRRRPQLLPSLDLPT